jgi:hypothetical protein
MLQRRLRRRIHRRRLRRWGRVASCVATPKPCKGLQYQLGPGHGQDDLLPVLLENWSGPRQALQRSDPHGRPTFEAAQSILQITATIVLVPLVQQPMEVKQLCIHLRLR